MKPSATPAPQPSNRHRTQGKKILGGLAIVSLLAGTAAIALAIKPGQKLPGFSLKTAFGKTYRLKDFKVPVLVFFYEGKNTKKQNRWIKVKLTRMRRKGKISKKKMRLIGIVNFQETPAPAALIRPFIKKEAKKTKALLLCDEDGRMQKKWGFRNGRSNIYVLDKKRRLRWRSSDKLSKKRGEQLIRFVYRLSNRY
jgi:peroxiredoxin